MSIEQVIRKLRVHWRKTRGFSARQINEGFCHAFAVELDAQLPDSRVIWNEEFDHAYVLYQGRIYDSEVPRGVRRYISLPYIKRQKC